uniref:Putative chymotrypsin inhibitor n=1 Tax=Ornithodoros turicata TaxID=34597 RepID=A0A2R5L7N3_9ACAR
MSRTMVFCLLFVTVGFATAVSLRGNNRPRFCYLPPDSGLCYGHFPSYHYSHQRGDCVQFVYGGCQGNRNRFNSYQECIRICRT